MAHHQEEFEKTLCVTLSDDQEHEIAVTLKGIWDNTGIGSYECHGYKGYDRGVDYFTIEDWEFDEKDYSQADLAEIHGGIEGMLETWEKEYAEECEKKRSEHD